MRAVPADDGHSLDEPDEPAPLADLLLLCGVHRGTSEVSRIPAWLDLAGPGQQAGVERGPAEARNRPSAGSFVDQFQPPA